MRKAEICIKARSPPAPRAFIGQVTKQNCQMVYYDMQDLQQTCSLRTCQLSESPILKGEYSLGMRLVSTAQTSPRLDLNAEFSSSLWEFSVGKRSQSYQHGEKGFDRGKIESHYFF